MNTLPKAYSWFSSAINLWKNNMTTSPGCDAFRRFVSSCSSVSVCKWFVKHWHVSQMLTVQPTAVLHYAGNSVLSENKQLFIARHLSISSFARSHQHNGYRGGSFNQGCRSCVFILRIFSHYHAAVIRTSYLCSLVRGSNVLFWLLKERR